MPRKIFQAVRTNDVQALAELLAKGHSPGRRPKDADSPLGQAAEYGTPEIVGLLLKAGAQPEDYAESNFSPLYRAVCQRYDDRGRLEIVRMLVDAGADMRRFTGSPSVFYVAIKGRRYEVARFLIERGCPIFPLCNPCAEEDPSFMIHHVDENPEFQRYLHEQIADILATQVNSEVYRAYYQKVPFRPDRVREKRLQEQALQQRREEQRRLRNLNP